MPIASGTANVARLDKSNSDDRAGRSFDVPPFPHAIFGKRNSSLLKRFTAVPLLRYA
jgi:hypothetical protein